MGERRKPSRWSSASASADLGVIYLNVSDTRFGVREHGSPERATFRLTPRMARSLAEDIRVLLDAGATRSRSSVRSAAGERRT